MGKSGVPDLPITFGAWGDPSAPNPLFDGSPQLLGNWQAQGTPNVWYTYVTCRPDDVWMNGITGTAQSGLGGLGSPGDWFWEDATRNLYQYCSSNPASAYTISGTQAIYECGVCNVFGNWMTIQNIDITNILGSGIYSRGGGSTSGSNIIIQNCNVKNSLGGIGVDGRYNQISGNTMVNLSGNGIYVSNGWCNITGNTINGIAASNSFVGLAAEGGNNTVTANIIHNVAAYAHLDITQNDIVTNNELSDDAPSANGLIVNGGCNVVSQNTIHQCKSGILLNPNNVFTGVSHNRIFNNRIFANSQTGLFISACDNSSHQISYNLIYANGGNGIEMNTPFNTATVMGNTICSNTVYGNTGFGLYAHNGLAAGNYYVADNIFANNQAIYQLQVDATSVLAHNNNCYYKTSSLYAVNYNGTIYAPLTLTAFETTAIGADPLFVNAGGYDFHLQGLSPCIDKGVVIPGLTRDFDNVIVPLGAVPEMGAYEYALAPHLTGLTWSDIPSLAFTQGSLKNTVFQLNCSAVAHDILNSLSLVNLGTAKAGTDISALWLYYSATGNSATATSVGQFTSAGSSTWSLAGLSHQAADGSSYFLLADIAPAATLGTTCQFSLPANQAQFQISGNFPTITFTNTYSQVINAFFMPEISADLNSAAVFRMVKGEASVPLAQIRLTNFTNHAVTLNSLQLALQAKEGSNLSPASLFTTLRLLQNQAVAATLAAPITSGGLFTFTPAITLPAQTQQALELQADLTTAPTEKHFRFALLDNQCLNQGQTLSQAVSGKSFPLATSVFSIYDPQLTSTFSNYPNPFSPSQGGTKIGYYLPQDAQIKLTLWTMDHRLVKTLVNEKQLAGMAELTWDGRNGEGNLVRNGVYLLVLDCTYGTGGHESLTRKIAVAK